MSQSPVPAATEQSVEGADDGRAWRASVQQANRNAEVKEIADVLASLEPGATRNSKMRLAMQFEDSEFVPKSLMDG